MKRITTPIIITSFRSKVDGSLGASFTTPELTTEEKVAFMQLQGVELDAVFIPSKTPQAPQMTVDKEMGQKTPSQRLRAVLFVWWQQLGSQGDFEDFYRKKMEGAIEAVKAKLD